MSTWANIHITQMTRRKHIERRHCYGLKDNHLTLEWTKSYMVKEVPKKRDRLTRLDLP
jgi:hypothetical protein